MWPEKRQPTKSLYIVFQQLAVRSGAAKPEVMVPDSSRQTQALARKSVHHDAGQGVGWPGNSICHCHHISGNAWPALVCVRMWFSCKPPGRILRESHAGPSVQVCPICASQEPSSWLGRLASGSVDVAGASIGWSSDHCLPKAETGSPASRIVNRHGTTELP